MIVTEEEARRLGWPACIGCGNKDAWERISIIEKGWDSVHIAMCSNCGNIQGQLEKAGT